MKFAADWFFLSQTISLYEMIFDNILPTAPTFKIGVNLPKLCPLLYHLGLCHILNPLLSFQHYSQCLHQVDFISEKFYHFLCSSIRNNSSFIQVLSWDCSNSVPSLDSTSSSNLLLFPHLQELPNWSLEPLPHHPWSS